MNLVELGDEFLIPEELQTLLGKVGGGERRVRFSYEGDQPLDAGFLEDTEGAGYEQNY